MLALLLLFTALEELLYGNALSQVTRLIYVRPKRACRVIRQELQRDNMQYRGEIAVMFGQTNDKPRSGEVQKKPTTVVASVSRSTSAGKIKLTQTQVALAKKLGLTPQQYAAEVAKLEKNNG